MNWIDYREKLGIGFNDKEKSQLLKNCIFNYLNFGCASKNIEKVYYSFCFMTGTFMETRDKFKFKFIEIFIKMQYLFKM